MPVLVTGAAGFIGYHVCRKLLARGEQVIGIDNLNSYYTVALKESRVADLKPHAGFTFLKQDFADLDGLRKAVGWADIDRIVHLGAQPGVRYSIDHPMAYATANLTGHLAMLELARESLIEITQNEAMAPIYVKLPDAAVLVIVSAEVPKLLPTRILPRSTVAVSVLAAAAL